MKKKRIQSKRERISEPIGINNRRLIVRCTAKSARGNTGTDAILWNSRFPEKESKQRKGNKSKHIVDHRNNLNPRCEGHNKPTTASHPAIRIFSYPSKHKRLRIVCRIKILIAIISGADLHRKNGRRECSDAQRTKHKLRTTTTTTTKKPRKTKQTQRTHSAHPQKTNGNCFTQSLSCLGVCAVCLLLGAKWRTKKQKQRSSPHAQKKKEKENTIPQSVHSPSAVFRCITQKKRERGTPFPPIKGRGRNEPLHASCRNLQTKKKKKKKRRKRD